VEEAARGWRTRAAWAGWLREGVAIPYDLALAGLVVVTLAMLLVPLPTGVVDVLIALNFAVSLGLLLVSMYVSDATRLASLPSMLLLATLFRLGLTISTTRLVLLRGDAGQVVRAFGEVVVAGNVVVGGVVFLVLTLVQFIVIAKGSERVAEVAARFTLDALPGKQMSIDADVRAGAVTMEEAQARRGDLERESQLYGALDGAMKFVKGDAIAGLVVTAVNIVGGLAVGVLQRGMSLGSAMSHYTILTVGDGLAAQIPALLIATTAGLIVTRVPGEDAGASLAGDIASQVLAQPRALGLTAGLLVLTALLPGLPAWPFLALAVGAGVASAAGLRRTPSPATRRRAPNTPADARLLIQPNATPIGVAVGTTALERVDLAAFARRVPDLRVRLYGELGLRVPEVLATRDAGLPPVAFEIRIGGVPALRGRLPEAPRWVDAPHADLAALGVRGLAHDLVGGRRVTWTGDEESRLAASAGYRTGDATEFAVANLDHALRVHAAEFIGVQEAREMADALEATHPALVGEVLPRLVSLAHLAEILRRLVAEEVSIRDLRGIFEALAAFGSSEREPAVLVEHIRSSMRRQLTAQATGGNTSVPVYLVAGELEDVLRATAQLARGDGQLPLDPALRSTIVEQFRSFESIERGPGAPTPVVVTAHDVRRHVRALIETDLPSLRVFSYQDLLPSVILQPLATVSIELAAL
jgi:type III secretion protein V